MSRFLTPSKIGLLALTSLYTDGSVVGSLATARVLSFLITHIAPGGGGGGGGSMTHPSSVSAADAHHMVPMAAFEDALSKVQLLPYAHRRDHQTVWDLFVERLWEIDCYSALDLFMGSLFPRLGSQREYNQKRRMGLLDFPAVAGGGPATAAPIIVESPLGNFIVRCHFEFSRLQFQDGIVLWQDFVGFRQPTLEASGRESPSGSQDLLDVNLSQLGIEPSHPLSRIMYGRLAAGEAERHTGFSASDLEKLMDFQANEMQRLGARLPDDMRAKIDKMIKTGDVLPKIGHYLRYLDAWRSGDYDTAFDNIHRFFDYTERTQDRLFYQYALLNLAIIQSDFGCYTDAIQSLQEAIAVARESKDVTCLSYCMSWVYHFTKTYPAEMAALRECGLVGNEAEGLAVLKTKAKDAEMWGMFCTTLLNEARLGLQHGDSLATIFENIGKAGHLNMAKSVGNGTGPILLMRGSVFSRAGATHVAWSCGEVFLESGGGRDRVPTDDGIVCICRMASLLVQRGRYREASEMMDSVPPIALRLFRFRQYHAFYDGTLKLRRHIHRHDIKAATIVLDRLKGQKCPDVELGFLLALLEVDLLMRRRLFDRAMALIHRLAGKVQGEIMDVIAHIKLLNLKARVLAQCGHPVKGLATIIRAMTLAYRARILPLLWEGTVILSHILIDRGEFAAAADLLEAIVPQALTSEDCDLVAQAFAHLVDANMGLAGEAAAAVSTPDSTAGASTASKQQQQQQHQQQHQHQREEFLTRALEYVDCAYDHYRHIEDQAGQLEMLAKKATILRFRHHRDAGSGSRSAGGGGELGMANDVAAQYLEVKAEFHAGNMPV